MRLLLDTHIAIWWVAGNERLKLPIRAMISDPGNDVAVSIVSLWEIAIKNNLRRPEAVRIGLPVHQAIQEFAASDFEMLQIADRHLPMIEQLPHHHGDPFDRMLVAQARTDNYRLVTQDSALAAYGDHVTIV